MNSNSYSENVLMINDIFKKLYLRTIFKYQRIYDGQYSCLDPSSITSILSSIRCFHNRHIYKLIHISCLNYDINSNSSNSDFSDICTLLRNLCHFLLKIIYPYSCMHSTSSQGCKPVPFWNIHNNFYDIQFWYNSIFWRLVINQCL